MTEVDIAIVGGGMVGASLAVALEGLGLRIALIEAVAHDSLSQPSFDERTTALSNGSRRILDTLGVWANVASTATPIRKIHVSDQGRFGFARIDAAAQGLEAMGYVVPNRSLGAALWASLASNRDLHVYCPAHVLGVTPGADAVTLEVAAGGAQTAIVARLVVAADGVQSAVRAVFGVAAQVRDYDQTAVITTVLPQRFHDYVAYERFTQSGPLALLPLLDGRCTLVLTLKPKLAEAALTWSDDEFLAELQQRFGFRLGRFLKVGRRVPYPLSLSQSGQTSAGRCVIVGNAAQGLHPVAGMGFNLGLRDVASLAELVAEQRRAGEIDVGQASMLRRYDAWRAADRGGIIAFTDGLVRLFSSPLGAAQRLRNFGLLAFDVLPPAKAALSRLSTGAAGKVPKLARGVPLRLSREFDVLVIGGGVTAMTMATALIARKLVSPGRVAVVAENISANGARVTGTDWDTRVFALSRASQRLLEACGTWQSLAGKFFAYERMCVWDARGEPEGEGSLTFDCAEINEPNLGFIADGRALQSAAAHAAAAAGAIFIEAQILALATSDTDVRVRLHDGRDLRGQLLIAADGTESRAREMLRIETAGHTYNQDALVAHVRTARPHRNTAWQRFLRTGPLAFLPLPDGRSSIVWSAQRAEAARLRALDAVEFGAALTLASGGVMGACELATPIASFPLKLQYALDYVRPRAVLLGDAAHVVHPLAGQGLNLGLLDCAALAEVLGEAGSTGFFGEQRLLRRYERRRRSENMLAASALDGLERLFASENPLVSYLRMTGLNAVGRVGFLKRQLAERALGISGDIPAFLAT